MTSNENHAFLSAMARDICSQDNAITADPIFYVQRHRRTYGFDPAYSDKHAYVGDEGTEVDVDTYDPDGYECPGCCEKLMRVDFDDEQCSHCGKALDLGNYCLTRTSYQDSWENVQPFFTRKGAEEYLRANEHNLTGEEPPRIYVDSAYRNSEWQAIRKMLVDLNAANVRLAEIKKAEAKKGEEL